LFLSFIFLFIFLFFLFRHDQDPMGGGLIVGATAAFHAALWKKNEWEKVC